MKNKYSLIIGAIALATAAGVKAQTAVTDPVGYITLTAKAGTASTKALSLVSPTLVNKVEFSGAITAITPTTITVAGTPLGTYATGAYYVEITSGTNAGYWTTITGGTSSSITTADDMDVVANPGDTIKIRKHVTISDLFGATNTAGLDAGDEIGKADVVTLVNSETKEVTRIFYYFDGDPASSAWLTAGGELANDIVIEPQQGVQITRTNAIPTDLNIVRVGHVKTGPTKLTIDPGLNLVGVPLATGTTLATSGLKGTSSSNGVLGADEIGKADVVRFIPATGPVVSTFLYQDGDPASEAWLDSGGDLRNDYAIKEGSAFFLSRKASAGPFAWSVPAQVIAQ